MLFCWMRAAIIVYDCRIMKKKKRKRKKEKNKSFYCSQCTEWIKKKEILLQLIQNEKSGKMDNKNLFYHLDKGYLFENKGMKKKKFRLVDTILNSTNISVRSKCAHPSKMNKKEIEIQLTLCVRIKLFFSSRFTRDDCRSPFYFKCQRIGFIKSFCLKYLSINLYAQYCSTFYVVQTWMGGSLSLSVCRSSFNAGFVSHKKHDSSSLFVWSKRKKKYFYWITQSFLLKKNFCKTRSNCLSLYLKSLLYVMVAWFLSFSFFFYLLLLY